MDPKELMEQAKKGDKEAFGKLYEEYYVPIYRYIHFRIFKKEDAQDLAQTVFLKVYQSIGKYKNKGTEPLAYFFTVARNTMIDYLRKRKELNLYDFVEIEAQNKDNPEEIAGKNETKEIVEKAILNLKDDQKEVVIMKFMIGLPNDEIAKQLGKSEDSIRQIQHRALETLKKKIKV